MAYDPATSQLILFGGYRDDGWRADTWTYTGGRQSQSITFSSTAPSSARYSGRTTIYTATAAATSGLPVTLSVAPLSTSRLCHLRRHCVLWQWRRNMHHRRQPARERFLSSRGAGHATLHHQPAPLSITASSPAMTYGGTVPAITPPALRLCRS